MECWVRLVLWFLILPWALGLKATPAMESYEGLYILSDQFAAKHHRTEIRMPGSLDDEDHESTKVPVAETGSTATPVSSAQAAPRNTADQGSSAKKVPFDVDLLWNQLQAVLCVLLGFFEFAVGFYLLAKFKMYYFKRRRPGETLPVFSTQGVTCGLFALIFGGISFLSANALYNNPVLDRAIGYSQIPIYIFVSATVNRKRLSLKFSSGLVFAIAEAIYWSVLAIVIFYLSMAVFMDPHF